MVNRHICSFQTLPAGIESLTLVEHHTPPTQPWKRYLSNVNTFIALPSIKFYSTLLLVGTINDTAPFCHYCKLNYKCTHLISFSLLLDVVGNSLHIQKPYLSSSDWLYILYEDYVYIIVFWKLGVCFGLSLYSQENSAVAVDSSGLEGWKEIAAALILKWWKHKTMPKWKTLGVNRDKTLLVWVCMAIPVFEWRCVKVCVCLCA